MNFQNETMLSKEEKNQFSSKQAAKENSYELRGGITIEQFQGMVATLSAVEETEEAEARCMDYLLKYTKEIDQLEKEQRSRVIDILFRAKYIENIMDMSVQEIFQIPEEKLEFY